MNFSASDLVKHSASQIAYLEIKKRKRVATPRQWTGNYYASEIAKKEKASEEKRGVYVINPETDDMEENVIFFCVDMVLKEKNTFVEIKMVQNETYEDWYLNSSIMQAVFFASLLEKTKTLDTPKFRKKEGFRQEIMQVPDKHRFELWFGEERFLVQPSEKILNHYIEKAKVVISTVESRNFDAVRLYDLKWKHKEFELLKPKYEKLEIHV